MSTYFTYLSVISIYGQVCDYTLGFYFHLYFVMWIEIETRRTIIHSGNKFSWLKLLKFFFINCDLNMIYFKKR